MKKILPLLLLFSFIVGQVHAQIPFGGYKLTGAPLDATGWIYPPNVTIAPTPGDNDEVILVENANDIGFIRWHEPRKLFFCDTTLVEFEYKAEPNANGGTDGFAFWILANNNNTNIASPGLGMPLNSTGHAVIFDLYDNDNNNNNPIIGARYFNNANYTEGSTTGILGTNRDTVNVAAGAGIWHKVKLVYHQFGSNPSNVNLEIYVNNLRVWQGVAFNTLPAANCMFGFSATNGTSNFSKLSIRNVSVKPLPLPVDVLVPTFCTDQAPPAFIYPTGGNAIWYTDLVTSTFSNFAPTIPVDSVDSFTYYLGSRVVINSAFCYGDRAEVKVKVHQSPTVDFEFTKIEGCGADTLTFYNKSKDAHLFNWNFGDGTDTVVFETNHVFDGAGTYNVVLRGENDYCKDSASQTIRLENPFIVDFNINADSICQNGKIEFANTSRVSDKNNIPTYWKWDFGTAPWDTLITKDPAEKVYYNPGTYNITLTVTNGLPCTDSVTKTIVVDPYPSLSFQRIDTVICVGDDITVNGEVLTEGLNSLTWDMGDGTPTFNNVKTVTKTYDSPGTYTITATADYRICPDSVFTRQIKVNAIPNVNLPKDTVLCAFGEGFTIKNAFNYPSASYYWSTGDTTESIAITNTGDYRLRVTVDGCSSEDNMTVNKDCYIDIPNAFSPDGDGNNDYFLPRNKSEQNISKFKMTIYNRYGQVIFETNQTSGRGWDGKFNGVEQPFGVYVYTIEVEFNNAFKETYNGNVTLIR